jgi:hypothetical protein
MTAADEHRADMAHLDVINTAWIAGYDVGYAHGRNARRDAAEALRLFEAAAEVVTRCAGLPEVDPEDTRRRALERERRWSA